MRNSIFALLGVISLVGLVGCSNEPEPVVAPGFPDGTGQQASNAKPYAEGPYGVGIGATIANYKFVGFPNAMVDNTRLSEIQLAEFYNPTGTGVYEEGSVMPVGQAKPLALVINVSSVWCPPCNEEADTLLPVKYSQYKPKGGEFLLQLADGAKLGKAATQQSLYNWTTKYEVDYVATIDPTYKLGALFEADAYPANMIVDTRTMKIVEVIAGTPNSTFWAKFDKTIAGTL
jgi:hypothetical protein